MSKKKKTKKKKRLSSKQGGIIKLKHDLYKSKFKDIEALHLLRFRYPFNDILSLIKSLPKGTLNFIFQDPWPKKYENICCNYSYHMAPKIFLEYKWNALTFIFYKEKIELFLKLQDEYECLFLAGDYTKAKSKLDEIEEENGCSIWGLEQRFLCLEHTEGLEANKTFLSEINNNNKIWAFLHVIAEHLSNKAELKMSVAKYNSYVEQFLSHYKDKKELQDYYRYKISSLDFDEIDGFDFILYVENHSSVIDRYLTFKRILQILCTKKLLENNLLDYKNLIIRLQKEISDPDLERISTYLDAKNNFTKDKLTEKYLEISDAYTVGDYQLARDKCGEIILAHPNSLEFCLLYLKSVIYAKSDLTFIFKSKETIIDNVLRALLSVLKKDRNLNDSVRYLLKQSLSLSSFQWANKLYLLLHKELDPDYSNNIKCYSMLLSKIHNVKQSLVYKNVGCGLEFLNNLVSIYGERLTIELWRHIETQRVRGEFKALDIKIDGLRTKIYNAKLYQYLGMHKEACCEYKKLLDQDYVNPVYNPYLYVNILFDLYNCLLSIGSYKEALELSVKAFIMNEYFIEKFDLNILIDHIERSEDEQIYKSICLAILFSIALKPTHKIYVAYDTYLTSLNIDKPSELFEIDIKSDNNLKNYFLYKICSIEVMYKSIYFDGTEDIENERLKILQYLALNDNDDGKKYTDEINIITKRRIIRKGIQQVGESKIFVDIEGLKKVLEQTMPESFARYLDFQTFDIDDFKLLDSKASGTIIFWNKAQKDDVAPKKDDIVFSSDIKFLLFSEMFYEIRDRFISSNEYGLDSYLSVRIRHGTLSGQLRKPFENEHLITQKDKLSNEYFTNKFWDTKFIEAKEGQIESLQKTLSDFSRTIDEIIRKFKEELIQIKTEGNNTMGLFDFSFDTIQLLSMYQNWYAEIRQYEAFVNRSIGDLLERTEFVLQSIKSYIIEELSSDMITKLDNLHADISCIFNDFRFSGLSSAIAACKTAVQNELSGISEWFNISRNKGFDEFSIELSTETSKNMVNNICQNNFNPKITIKNNARIKGRYFNPLVDIFYILFDNATKHSGKDIREVSSNLFVDVSENAISIKMDNELNSDIDLNDLKIRIKDIYEMILTKSALEKISKEGGTGIIKIQKILQYDLGSEEYTIIPEINDNYKYEINIKANLRGILA